MRRGVAPLVLGAGLVAGALLLYLGLTPQGHAIVKTAIDFTGDVVNIGYRALNLLVQLMSISFTVMTVSFSKINTVTGMILFLMSLVGNFAIGYTILIFMVIVAEKIKNIIKPV